jgi:hypothetical protein
MLRLFAFFLLIANGLFYIWSNGYLSQWGFASSYKGESFRINEQIEPDRITIRKETTAVTPKASDVALTASAPDMQHTPNPPTVSTTTVCLNAGVFDDQQSAVLQHALSTKLPDVSWRFDTVIVPARWIVYMGKYANNAARDLKKSQLDKIKVRYQVLTEGNLEPGLSLGSHATQAAADQSLQQLLRQGVRTARVLQESPEQKGQNLVVPAVDEINRGKLNAVYAALATQLANQTLQICK